LVVFASGLVFPGVLSLLLEVPVNAWGEKHFPGKAFTQNPNNKVLGAEHRLCFSVKEVGCHKHSHFKSLTLGMAATKLYSRC